jgi:hypothetical protein
MYWSDVLDQFAGLAVIASGGPSYRIAICEQNPEADCAAGILGIAACREDGEQRDKCKQNRSGIRHNRARLFFATHVGDLRRIYGVRLERVAVLPVFAQKPLSFAGDILDKLRNRWRGSKPVDKAFSGFSVAFFLEKLDENKFCGNHRST